MKALLSLLTLCSLLFAEDGVKKLVLDLTSGNIETIEKRVIKGIVFNKDHYESKLEKLQVAVVIHGDAYKFFIQDLHSSPYASNAILLKKQSELGKRLASLASTYEVEFLMCQSGMKSKNIDPKTLYKFVHLVPSSTTGLIDKQNEGYAYVPVH